MKFQFLMMNLMSCFSSEFEFQSALIRRLKAMGMYRRNIPDIGNTKKPFDLSVNYKGRGWALELKIIKTQKEPTPENVYKKLYPHQIANLLEFQSWKSQWVSRVIAYHGWTNSVRIYTIRKDWEQVRLKESCHYERFDKNLEEHFDLIF